MADERPVEPAPEPSWRQRLAELDAEDELAAKGEYEARIKAREEARKAPLTVQGGPGDAGRGIRPDAPGRPLERGLEPGPALDPDRQRAMREAAKGQGIRYR